MNSRKESKPETDKQFKNIVYEEKDKVIDSDDEVEEISPQKQGSVMRNYHR